MQPQNWLSSDVHQADGFSGEDGGVGDLCGGGGDEPYQLVSLPRAGADGEADDEVGAAYCASAIHEVNCRQSLQRNPRQVIGGAEGFAAGGVGGGAGVVHGDELT